MRQMYEEEMALTMPPEKCEQCTCGGDCNSFEHLVDNRANLYRLFKMVTSEHKGVWIYKCRACGTTAFSREALYHITDEFGKHRIAWVAERVKCNGCGTDWHRVEKENKQNEDGTWR